jgi:hypothetical protein
MLLRRKEETMTLGAFEFVHTRDELVSKLRQLGIGSTSHARVGENLYGAYDSAISFAGPEMQVQTVGFRSSEVPVVTAHQVLSELTALRRQPAKAVGVNVITDYTPF